MKDPLPRYTMRISRERLDKIKFIAHFEGRTTNKELEQLVLKRTQEFEREHGEIVLDPKDC